LYVWQKKESGSWNEDCPFPRDVDFMIADTMESMRPKLNMHTSLNEAHEAVAELNKEYEEKISMFCFVFSFYCYSFSSINSFDRAFAMKAKTYSHQLPVLKTLDLQTDFRSSPFKTKVFIVVLKVNPLYHLPSF